MMSPPSLAEILAQIVSGDLHNFSRVLESSQEELQEARGRLPRLILNLDFHAGRRLRGWAIGCVSNSFVDGDVEAGLIVVWTLTIAATEHNFRECLRDR